MCSACRLAVVLLLPLAAGAAELKVCADPANLPFSNREHKGFENEIASIVAGGLGRQVQYVWRPQVGHFLKSLRQGECDVIMGLAGHFDSILLSDPYYRSSYVLLSRKGSHPIRSLGDPALKTAKIGVQLIGADQASSPGAAVLAQRGLIRNAVWFRLVQTYVTPNDTGALVNAVAHGDVDAAIAWGPSAGFFAHAAAVPMTVTPLGPHDAAVATDFAVCLGVRPGATDLQRQINHVLASRGPEIHQVLRRFGVPLLAAGKGGR